MKQRILAIVLVAGLLLFLMVWSFGSSAAGNSSKPADRDSVEANKLAQGQGDKEKDVDADLGKWGSRPGIDREEYLRLRDEYVARKRGIEPGRPFDPSMRGRAIDQMERQEKNHKIEALSAETWRLRSAGHGPRLVRLRWLMVSRYRPE